MAAKKKVSRRAKSRAPKSERRMDLTSAKSPRGGALAAPESRVMTIKGATVKHQLRVELCLCSTGEQEAIDRDSGRHVARFEVLDALSHARVQRR